MAPASRRRLPPVFTAGKRRPTNMQEYAIEYLDHGRLARVLVVGTVLLLGSYHLLLRFLEDGVIGLAVVGGGLAIATGLLFIRKHKVRRTGVVLIGYERIALDVFNRLIIVIIHDIAYYHISHCHGVALTLVLKDGKKISVSAHDSFCDSSKLQRACEGVQQALKEFRAGKQMH